MEELTVFQTRMVLVCLGSSAAPALCGASTIAPLTASRGVNVSIGFSGGELQANDADEAFSDTLDPFNESVLASALIPPIGGSIGASYISDITPLSITGTADLSGSLEIPEGAELSAAGMNGSATLNVTFMLSEPTAYTLVASASASTEAPNSEQGVVLTGPSGIIVSDEGVDGYVATLNTGGVLVPGEYLLFIYFSLIADAPSTTGPITTTALGHFDVNFQVPEPSSAAALGVLALLVLRRR